jgi:hypothetical protein
VTFLYTYTAIPGTGFLATLPALLGTVGDNGFTCMGGGPLPMLFDLPLLAASGLLGGGIIPPGAP